MSHFPTRQRNIWLFLFAICGTKSVKSVSYNRIFPQDFFNPKTFETLKIKPKSFPLRLRRCELCIRKFLALLYLQAQTNSFPPGHDKMKRIVVCLLVLFREREWVRNGPLCFGPLHFYSPSSQSATRPNLRSFCPTRERLKYWWK